jgi:hypothetical protein
MVLDAVGSIAMSPMLRVGSASVSGVQAVPLVVLFQSPPSAEPM